MKRRETAEADFRSALLWSLLIHVGVLGLFAGLGGVLTPERKETELEWVWSAPQPAPQPAASVSAVAPPSVVQPAASATLAASLVPAAPVTPAPTPPQAISPQTTGPRSAVPQTAPPPVSSPQPPVATGPPEDVPSGTGYAIVPPRLRERPPLVMPAALADATGEVLLQVEVLADGRAGASRVIRSSGRRDLDEMARQNVAGWIFQPAWQPQTNKPVRVLTSVWVRFGAKKE